jgi:pimeloyl-ACP methyl ester carboxylesterase
MRHSFMLLVALTFCACAHVPPPAQSGSVPVEGGSLYYTVEGRGEPLVLVHGGFMDHRMWEPQRKSFSKEYRVIRYDMRGHGRSPASTAPYDPAADVAALLDHLEIPAAHILGISMGGSFAIDFAILYPQRTRSLVVAEPGLSGHKWSSDVIGTMRSVRQAFTESGRDAAIRTFMERPVFASARNKPKAYEMIREQLEANLSMEARPMKPMEPPAIDRLREIKAPTLVIVSTLGGPDSRAIRDLIARDVPNARQATITDSGHMMNLEQPEQFNAMVLSFLREQ